MMTMHILARVDPVITLLLIILLFSPPAAPTPTCPDISNIPSEQQCKPGQKNIYIQNGRFKCVQCQHDEYQPCWNKNGDGCHKKQLCDRPGEYLLDIGDSKTDSLCGCRAGWTKDNAGKYCLHAHIPSKDIKVLPPSLRPSTGPRKERSHPRQDPLAWYQWYWWVASAGILVICILAGVCLRPYMLPRYKAYRKKITGTLEKRNTKKKGVKPTDDNRHYVRVPAAGNKYCQAPHPSSKDDTPTSGSSPKSDPSIALQVVTSFDSSCSERSNGGQVRGETERALGEKPEPVEHGDTDIEMDAVPEWPEEHALVPSGTGGQGTTMPNALVQNPSNISQSSIQVPGAVGGAVQGNVPNQEGFSTGSSQNLSQEPPDNSPAPNGNLRNQGAEGL